MVTAGTYGKALLFNTDEKRDLLMQSLFEEAAYWGWNLQAWAVMANHYHFVACSPDDTKSLIRMLTSLHSKTAITINRMDGVTDRKVWFQYRDTCLTYERSYMARLKYVH